MKLKCNYQTFSFHDKVVFKEDESNDGEEVDEDDGQDCRQEDGTSVTCHRFHHVDQGLLSVNHIEELKHFCVELWVYIAIGFDLFVDLAKCFSNHIMSLKTSFFSLLD